MGEFHTPMPDASTFIDQQQKEGGTVLNYFDFKPNKRAQAKNLLEGVKISKEALNWIFFCSAKLWYV